MEKGFTIPVLDHGYVRYIDHMGDDQRIVEAARVSYKSPSKGAEADKKLLFRLFRCKHSSPFEMGKITLNIKLPMFIMREYTRHRMQNLNEMSARYVELPNDFYIPTSWRRQDTKNKQSSIKEEDWNPWHQHPREDGTMAVGSYITGAMDATGALQRHCIRSYEFYEQLLKEGVAREMARMVLPVNIYTEAYVSWDVKNLLHFIGLRDDPAAQWEMQQYAKALKVILAELFPWCVEAFNRYKFPFVDSQAASGDLPPVTSSI